MPLASGTNSPSFMKRTAPARALSMSIASPSEPAAPAASCSRHEGVWTVTGGATPQARYTRLVYRRKPILVRVKARKITRIACALASCEQMQQLLVLVQVRPLLEENLR